MHFPPVRILPRLLRSVEEERILVSLFGPGPGQLGTQTCTDFERMSLGLFQTGQAYCHKAFCSTMRLCHWL